MTMQTEQSHHIWSSRRRTRGALILLAVLVVAGTISSHMEIAFAQPADLPFGRSPSSRYVALQAAPVFGDKWVMGRTTKWSLYESILRKQITQKISDKITWGHTADSFKVRNMETGELLINADSKILTMRGRLVLREAQSNAEICTLRQVLLRTTPTYKIECGGECLATIRADRLSPFRKSIRVYKGDASFNLLTGSTDAEPLLLCQRGLLLRNRFWMYAGDTGEKVASVEKSWFSFFFGRWTGASDYIVKVEPGGDTVTILATMMVKNELKDLDEARAKALAHKSTMATDGLKQTGEDKAKASAQQSTTTEAAVVHDEKET